jgi:hypothetical protein
MDNYRDAVNARVKVMQARWSLRRLYRRIFHKFHRYSGSRVVIIESKAGFHAEFQRRAFWLFWQTAKRTEEFKHFTALLMELGDQYGQIQALKGQRISRQARRAFSRRVTSKI